MNLLLSNKRWWLIVGVSSLLIFLAYKFITDWQWEVPTNSQVIISLKRTGCLGMCPTYAITIYDNGTVVYEGVAYVGVRGTRKANIGAATVQNIAAELESAGYFLLQDSYTQQMYIEGSSIYTYVKIGDKEKQIHHYGGDTSAPEELYRLEKRIDDTANSTRWVDACSFAFPNFCRFNVAFWILVAVPLAVAISIAWSFIKQHRGIVGIMLGEIVVAAVWIFTIRALNNYDLFGISWTTIVFYNILGFSECITLLLVGLFLVRRYKLKALQKATG